MSAYSIVEAKHILPELIDRALRGEEVVITRDGKLVAELRPVQRRPAPPRSTHDWLRSRRDARPGVGLTSVEILNQLRESNGVGDDLVTGVLSPAPLKQPARPQAHQQESSQN